MFLIQCNRAKKVGDCSGPDAHLFQNTKSEHSMNIYVIPTYVQRQMLYLPAALNSKKMLGNMSAVVLLPTFSYTPSLSTLWLSMSSPWRDPFCKRVPASAELACKHSINIQYCVWQMTSAKKIVFSNNYLIDWFIHILWSQTGEHQ